MSRLVHQGASQYQGEDRNRFIQLVQNEPMFAAQVRAPLYEDKVVDYLFSTAEVTERKGSREQLEADLESEEGHVHGPGCGHDHIVPAKAKKARAERPAAKAEQKPAKATAKPAKKADVVEKAAAPKPAKPLKSEPANKAAARAAEKAPPAKAAAKPGPKAAKAPAKAAAKPAAKTAAKKAPAKKK
jgi:trigger factor